MSFKNWEDNNEQDSRAIQHTSEVVNDKILKYIKTVIICFGWGASAPPDPLGWGSAPDPVFLRCEVPQTHKQVQYFKKYTILHSTSLSKRFLK